MLQQKFEPLHLNYSVLVLCFHYVQRLTKLNSVNEGHTAYFAVMGVVSTPQNTHGWRRWHVHSFVKALHASSSGVTVRSPHHPTSTLHYLSKSCDYQATTRHPLKGGDSLNPPVIVRGRGYQLNHHPLRPGSRRKLQFLEQKIKGVLHPPALPSDSQLS